MAFTSFLNTFRFWHADYVSNYYFFVLCVQHSNSSLSSSEDAANGDLPNFAFIEPCWWGAHQEDGPPTCSNDQHPDHSVHEGTRARREVQWICLYHHMHSHYSIGCAMQGQARKSKSRKFVFFFDNSRNGTRSKPVYIDRWVEILTNDK